MVPGTGPFQSKLLCAIAREGGRGAHPTSETHDPALPNEE